MEQNEWHFISFEYEWEVNAKNLRDVLNSYSTIKSPLFPSDSGQQWLIEVFRFSDGGYSGSKRCLRITPQKLNFLFGTFCFSYDNGELGCIYYNERGTSDPKELNIDCIANQTLSRTVWKIICKGYVAVKQSIRDAATFKSLLKMSEDFERLFESKQDSDVTFCVKKEKKIFKAHRAVLIARSTVFATMFENKLEESQSGKIQIMDIDYEVIEEMLRYMYTGKVPKLDTLTAELLYCAEKYELDDLKEKCLTSLQTHITIKNAASTLKLADKYRSEELKGHAINYIIENAKGVTQTKVWRDMITSHPHLIEEAFRMVTIEPPAKIQKMN